MILAPFATAASEYCEAGLAVIPCNGKVPAVLWQNMKRRPSQATVQKWADSKPKANVGALTELSKLTVVDVDHPELLDPAIDEFGETPAVAKTGKGFHLYYLHAGERTLTNFHPGVDVRAAKGFIVLPPSVHPDTKKQYAWIEGGPETLSDLPQVRPGSLPLWGMPSTSMRSPGASTTSATTPSMTKPAALLSIAIPMRTLRPGYLA